MSDLLKGNYKSPKLKGETAAKEPKSPEGFEQKALERLGGSIAFVMKSKTFLWSPDDAPAPKTEPEKK